LSALRPRLHAQPPTGHQSIRGGPRHVRPRAGREHTDGDLPAMMTPIPCPLTGVLTILVLAAACSRGNTGGPNPKPFASGTLRNAAGERVGLATLTDSAGTVRLGVSASQLS